jgi:hypothetical protein
MGVNRVNEEKTYVCGLCLEPFRLEGRGNHCISSGVLVVDDLLGAPAKLRKQGIEPLSFFGVETTEPSVISWMPAASIYFRDPDGHMLEYLSMLETEPRPDLGIIPWSKWLDRSK